MPYVHCKELLFAAWILQYVAFDQGHISMNISQNKAFGQESSWESGMRTRLQSVKKCFAKRAICVAWVFSKGTTPTPFKDESKLLMVAEQPTNCIAFGLIKLTHASIQRVLILEQVSITHVRPYCRSFFYISFVFRRWTNNVCIPMVHDCQRLDCPLKLCLAEDRILTGTTWAVEVCIYNFPFSTVVRVWDIFLAEGVLTWDTQDGSTWNLLEEVAWFLSIGSRCGICMHLHAFAFQHLFFI